KVVLPESVRGKDVFLIQCAIDQTRPSSLHRNIWETLQTIDVLRNCHAQYITLVMPCMPYARQDKRWGREPSSAMLLAKMIGAAGADAFITMDMHADQIKGYFELAGVIPDALYASNIFIPYIRKNYNLSNLVIVPPDAGGVKRAFFYAEKIFGTNNSSEVENKVIFVTKKRSLTKANVVDFTRVEGDVRGKTVLMVDDIVDTGGTLVPIIQTMHAKGAKHVCICATHGIMSEPAISRFSDLYAERKLGQFLTTDTIPHNEALIKSKQWLKRLSVAPMLAEMIMRINQNKPTSSLYL
ncbi:ribose-phosphate pyrophosphokinase, partial [Candidatus Woesearchaeota archaeon]|nr:ribose-phosphate pyrophosphokinase [Candidatus Woesearchaeota archaeon]